MASSTFVRIKIGKLKVLRYAGFFYPVVMGIYMVAKSLWDLFSGARRWGTFPTEPIDIAILAFVAVGALVALATYNVIEGQIILAEIELERRVQEDTDAEAARDRDADPRLWDLKR